MSIGLLKIVKGRWAGKPLAFRFYHMEKTIAGKKVRVEGKIPLFQTKFEPAIEMLLEISAAFPGTPLLIVTDSWFGNDGLLKPMRKTVGQHCHMLSRLRVNTTLFALPPEHRKHQLGRSRKYGDKMGNATTLANEFLERATTYSVNLYGKQRDVLAFDNIMMLKTLKCAVRVVWIYRRSVVSGNLTKMIV